MTVLVPLATSCAGHGSGSGGRPDPSRITREQIAAVHYTSVYEVVEALHNTWLRPRGTDSFQNPGQVIVDIDENRLGGVGHTQGVIHVVTQVGP